MEIIICIILLVLFITITIICALKDEPMAATFSGFFALIVMVILYFAIKESQEPVYDVSYPVTVYDVTDLQVDTVKTIRGLDTTETYVITYSKEQK